MTSLREQAEWDWKFDCWSIAFLVASIFALGLFLYLRG